MFRFIAKQSIRSSCQNQCLRRPLNLGCRWYTQLPANATIEDTLKQLPSAKKSDEYSNVIEHSFNRLSSLEKKEEHEQEAAKLYPLSRALIKSMNDSEEINSKLETKLLSQFIEKFAKFNYGAASTAFRRLRELKKHDLTSHLEPSTASELIKYNSGRVQSSWELFMEVSGEDATNDVKYTLLEKLIQGDPVDIKDGATAIDLPRAVKIFKILDRLEDDVSLNESHLEKLSKDLIDLDLSKALIQLKLPQEIMKSITESKEGENLKDSDYYYLYESVKAHGDKLSSELLLKSFVPISRLQTSHEKSKNFEEFVSSAPVNAEPTYSPEELAQRMRKEIQNRHLDRDFRVKLDMLESAGFDSNDLPTALKYFEKYQTQIPASSKGTDDLKSAMSLAFVYSAIKNNKDEGLTVAKTLIPQVPQPRANNTASIMLRMAWFGDGDGALELYNKSLDQFMKPRDDPNNAKARGMLVEALILSTLLDGDLGLARFIKLRCVEAKLMDEEHDKNVNNIFKKYGFIIEKYKDDANARRDEMKKMILQSISNMSP